MNQQPFHDVLDEAADDYKNYHKAPSTMSDSFLVDFFRMSQEMEFEILDRLIIHIKTLKSMDETTQKFVLGLLKGELSVSSDRFENLVQIVEITQLRDYNLLN